MGAVITITLNGKERDVSREQTVGALLETLNINAKQVAVAVNGEVVPRSSWQDYVVQDGDAVEIVRAVGGGSR